jgi:hypothetical protein
MATKTRLLVLITGLAAALAVTAQTPASAKPFEHITFHSEFDTARDCGNGLVLEFHDVMDGRQLVVWHGDGFLYATGHLSLTAVTVIPGTDLTLTVVNKGMAYHDVQVTLNSDGTYILKAISPARVAILGPDGRPESHFSGLQTIEQLWDDAGTPEDPLDDVFLEDLSSSLRGHFADTDICEVAQRYLP